MIKLKFLMVIVLLLTAHNGFAQSIVGEKSTTVLSPAVQKIVEQKIELIEKKVARDACVINEVKRYNEKNENYSMEEIKKADEAWRVSKKTVTDFMKEFLTGPLAEFLIVFQESHEGFVEMFMTDVKGLNVAMTNKTSDYLQSDEDWWVKCYADGQGRAYYSDIEYDEIAMSESISVFVPVKDPQDNKVIGVIKAVIDITSIQRELQ